MICGTVTGAWVVGFGDGGVVGVETIGGTVIGGDGAWTSVGYGLESLANFALFFGLDFSVLDLVLVLDDDFGFEGVYLDLVMVERGRRILLWFFLRV